MAKGIRYINEHGQEIWGYLLNNKLMQAAYFDSRLQNKTIVTLGLLISQAYSDGLIKHFSIQDTATKTNVSRWAIQKQLTKLEEYGYLKKERISTDGQRNHYRLLYDNYKNVEGVTQLDDTPPVTQLGDTDVTLESDTGVTQLGDTKKRRDKREIKKEKGALKRDEFLSLVKEEIDCHGFQEIGNLSEGLIIKIANECWLHWDGFGFPSGNVLSAFKGYLSKGIKSGAIKEASSELKDSAVSRGERKDDFINPLQDWQKQVLPIVADGAFKIWLRQLHWDENDNKILAPNRMIADKVRQNYGAEINKVLPDAEIIHAPYKPEEQKSDKEPEATL